MALGMPRRKSANALPATFGFAALFAVAVPIEGIRSVIVQERILNVLLQHHLSPELQRVMPRV